MSAACLDRKAGKLPTRQSRAVSTSSRCRSAIPWCSSAKRTGSSEVGSTRMRPQKNSTSSRSNGARMAVAFALAVSVASTLAHSDASEVHQKTTLPEDARFEIVQSPLAAKWTFRLDRHTGQVYQLVKTPDDGKAWELMLVEDLPAIQGFSEEPRFTIFTSGLAARHTFLMDTVTGLSWVLTEVDLGAATTINVWKPFQP